MGKYKQYIIFGLVLVLINIITSYVIYQAIDSSNSYDYSISKIEQKVSQLNEEIASLKSKINDLDYQYSDLEDEISSLQRKIRYLGY